jgi:A118 family predicted phage portal protein
MFQKLLIWLQEIINKMIGQSSVKNALHVDIAISPRMAEFLLLWSRMYTNFSPWLSDEVKSLNLPVAISSEIARSVTIEMKVEVTDEATQPGQADDSQDADGDTPERGTSQTGPEEMPATRAAFLNEQIQKAIAKMRIEVEFAVAKGGMVFKPYVDGDDLAIDFVQADQFYPVAFDSNGNITSCVFADSRRLGQYFYTRLEYHALDGENYTIRNAAFRSTTQNDLGQEVPLADILDWAELQPETTLTGIERPLFAYFKYPLANSIDTTSALGVSCFSRAVAEIEQADRQWSSLLWEFESGQRALYVDELAFGKDDHGKPILPNKRLYRTLNQGSQVGDDNLFEEWSPTFREKEILNGLEAILRKIEFKCGIAYGTLSNPTVIEKTATEIKTAQQRTYATITDTQKALQNAVEQLLYAMNVWTTIYTLAPEGEYQETFNFDDSLVSDSNIKFLQDSQALGLGVISKVEFRMRNYGETEQVAKKAVAEIQKEQAANSSLFPTQPTKTTNPDVAAAEKPGAVQSMQKQAGF